MSGKYDSHDYMNGSIALVGVSILLTGVMLFTNSLFKGENVFIILYSLTMPLIALSLIASLVVLIMSAFADDFNSTHLVFAVFIAGIGIMSVSALITLSNLWVNLIWESILIISLYITINKLIKNYKKDTDNG